MPLAWGDVLGSPGVLSMNKCERGGAAALSVLWMDPCLVFCAWPVGCLDCPVWYGMVWYGRKEDLSG